MHHATLLLSVFFNSSRAFLSSLQRTSFSSAETIITRIVSSGKIIPPKRRISHRKKCLGKKWICVRGGDGGVGTMGGVYREHIDLVIKMI